jgi:hypothetical protein
MKGNLYRIKLKGSLDIKSRLMPIIVGRKSQTEDKRVTEFKCVTIRVVGRSR